MTKLSLVPLYSLIVFLFLFSVLASNSSEAAESYDEFFDSSIPSTDFVNDAQERHRDGRRKAADRVADEVHQQIRKRYSKRLAFLWSIYQASGSWVTAGEDYLHRLSRHRFTADEIDAHSIDVDDHQFTDSPPFLEFKSSTSYSSTLSLVSATPTPYPSSPPTPSPVICSPDSITSLMDFFHAAGGPYWTNNSGWGGNTTCCSWFGIQCVNGLGITLLLNNVSGTFSPALCNVPPLNFIKITGAVFSGEFPWCLLSHANMFTVDISLSEDSTLSGTIPSAFESSPLSALMIFNAKFHGSIPEALGVFTALSILQLSNDGLTGPLPLFPAGRLAFSLLVEYNSLSGTIPSLYCLSTFSVPSSFQLVAIGNRLNGTIPTCLYSTVQTIDLRANQLTGEIVCQNVSSMGLYSVLLGSNVLTGTIPDCVSQWKNLEDLDISHNFFSGTFPPPLCSLYMLRTLSLEANYFSGTIPTCIGQLEFASSIRMSENQFVGTIPTEFGSLSFLEDFSASMNGLTGTLPSFSYFQLKHFSVSFNSLTGTLPAQLCLLVNLTHIDMRYNNFYGMLPSCIFSLKHLEVIQLHNLDLGTSLPSSLCSMPLSVLELESVDIYGTIPSCLCMLSDLTVLSFRLNWFSGTIPACLLNLPSLTMLDLAFNQLGGSLSNLSCPVFSNSLNILRLGSNLLEGTIPECMFLSGNDFIQFDLSSNQISGTIPNTVCIANVNVLSLGYNQLSSTVPACLFNSMSMLGALNVEHNRLELALGDFCVLTVLQILRIGGNWVSGTIPNCLVTMKGLFFLSITSTQISGSLPPPLFERSTSLVVNVTDCTSLRAVEPVTDNLDFSTMLPFYENGGAFHCPRFVSQSSSALIGIPPSYYDYQNCSCLPSFHGIPPNCKGNLDDELQYIIPISLLVPGLLIASIWAFHARRRRRRKLLADFLLVDYADATNLKALSEAQDSIASAEDMVIPYRSLRIMNEIGHGASAVVSLAFWHGRSVAVKTFHNVAGIDTDEFERECGVHCRLRHPHIVTLYGICQSPLCTVTEFMERGSLFHVIESNRESLRGHTRSIAVGIVRGMEYLHGKNIIHRDLKSLNVLVSSDFGAKIADFGASREQMNRTMTAGVGTAQWMAPEVSKSGRYTMSSDVYSFGIVLWELVTGRQPFVEYRFSYQVLQMVADGKRPEIPSDCEPSLAALISQCWDGDEAKRPTFRQISEYFDQHPDLVIF